MHRRLTEVSEEVQPIIEVIEAIQQGSKGEPEAGRETV